MRPLTTSISRAELSRLLDLPVEAIDALLESGRVLCRMKNGEPHVPLEQLETFFRDALMRIYRAEVESDEPPSERATEREPSVEPRRERAMAEASIPEPAMPEADVSEPLPPEGLASMRDENVVREVVRPASSPPPPRLAPSEQRLTDRYVPLRRLGGIFGETKFTILQMSKDGLRIRHDEALLPGTEAKLSFALLMPARSVVVRARVVWTSLAKAGEEQFSISGLRIIEHADRLEQAIESLKSTNQLQPERRAQVRRATDGVTMVEDISDEEMALVTAAIKKFATDPVEASRWYSRARFALSDENVRRAAPRRPRDREEVLGIWEYLDRQVDIGKIAGVVNWMRT